MYILSCIFPYALTGLNNRVSLRAGTEIASNGRNHLQLGPPLGHHATLLNHCTYEIKYQEYASLVHVCPRHTRGAK